MHLLTDRLLLRPYSIGDFDALREIDSDPEVTRYRSRQVITAEMTRDFIRDYEQVMAVKRPARYGFVVVLRDTDRVIGQCGVTREGERKAFIWYSLNRRYWGHGYITEAARAVVDVGFTQWDVERILANCHPANIGSVRVMEKIGMTRYTPNIADGVHEALLKQVNYGIDRADWTA